MLFKEKLIYKTTKTVIKPAEIHCLEVFERLHASRSSCQFDQPLWWQQLSDAPNSHGLSQHYHKHW